MCGQHMVHMWQVQERPLLVFIVCGLREHETIADEGNVLLLRLLHNPENCPVQMVCANPGRLSKGAGGQDRTGRHWFH